MKLRALFVFGLLSSVAASFASFEMMLIAGDTGIHRYDPQNNVSLGKFGQLDAGHSDVALDPTRPGEVISITGNGGVARYDYNTGEYRGGFSVGGIFVNEIPKISVMSNGNILVSVYTAAAGSPITNLYSPTGQLISSLMPFGNLYQTLDSIQAPDGTIHTLVRASSGVNYDYFLFNFSSVGTYVNFTTIQAGAPTSNIFGNLGILNGKVVVSSGYTSSAPTRLSSFNSGFSSAPTQISITSAVVATGASNYVSGHNGYGYMVHSWFSGGVQNNRLYRYNPGFNTAGLTNTTVGINDQLYGSAIVIAPEPGTMIALGVGLAAIVRRRKNRG